MVSPQVAAEEEHKTDFVDRKSHLAELSHYKNAVDSGEGKTVFIKGETGVGKTRLAEEFLKECENQGFNVLKSRCLYYETSEPYLPYYEALEDHLEEDRSEDFGPAFIQPGSSTSSESAPMSLMGGSQGLEDESETSISNQREMMFNRVADLLEELSEDRPLIFFMDDLQWIDKSSAQLMHHLARNISENSILLLGAFREEELRYVEEELPMKQTLDRMKEEDLANIIEVSRLDQPATGKLVKNYLDREDLPDDFTWAVYRESEGNPFYVVEMLDSMREEGVIRPDSYTWDPEEELSNISIPSTIKDITSRRVERLDKDEKKVLNFASLIGAEFNFQILEEVIDMDVIELLDIIDDLEEQGMIEEVEDKDEELYQFHHLQTRTTLYEDMGSSRKRVSHKMIGEALEDFYSENIEDHYYELSTHFYEGKQFEKAYEYSRKSAERSLKSLDITRAIEYYEKALESLRKGSGIEKQTEKEMEILKRLGHLNYDMGEWRSAEEIYQDLIDKAEDSENEEMKALGQRRLGHVYKNMEMFGEAKSYCEKSLELCEKLGDKKGISECHRGLGYVYWRRGYFDQAEKHYEKAIRNSKKSGDNKELALNYIDLGSVYAQRGNHDRAMQYYKKSVPILNSRDIYDQLARAYNNIGDQYMKKDEYDRAVEYFDKCIENAERIGNDRYKGWGSFNAAEALTKNGEAEKASEYLEGIEEIMKDLGEKLGLAGVKRVKGMIKRKVDKDLEGAIDLLTDSKEIMEDFNVPFNKGEDMYELGLAYKEKGDIEKAEKSFKNAKRSFEEVDQSGEFVDEVEKNLEELEEIKA